MGAGAVRSAHAREVNTVANSRVRARPQDLSKRRLLQITRQARHTAAKDRTFKTAVRIRERPAEHVAATPRHLLWSSRTPVGHRDVGTIQICLICCRHGDAVEAQNEVMETWDALRARRNVRKFTAQPVPEDALDRILEAGRRSPSASNWQPWDFVLVTDRPQLVELAKVWQGAGHVAGAAAAISIVAPVPKDDRQSALLQFDLGQATYAMTVAAADLGVGTGHAAAADQEQARAVLGLPQGRFLAYVLSVGYPADRPLAVIDRLNRRPFDEVVHRGRW